MKGKTESGFSYEVNKKKLQDVRFLMAYKKAAQSNELAEAVFLIPMILGDEQAEALFTHCEKDGVSDVEDVWAEFEQIVSALADDAETKN